MEINKTYLFLINVYSEKPLTFTGTITKIQNNFVSFIEKKYGKLKTYNLNSIISYEEVEK